MEKISVVVPCYNEEDSIKCFYDEIKKIEKRFKRKKVVFEIIFIDDGSIDNTLNIIKDLSRKDKTIKYISFSRNFGKEAAMYAGLENSVGDYVTVIDVDLQDPPELLFEMYDSIKNEGYDSVGVRRVNRKGEPLIRSFFARIFYKLINKMSKVEMVDGARDYRLMKREMVNAIVSMKEYNRYSKGLFSFVGYKTKWLEYENIERRNGETKWSFCKLFLYAIDGIVAFTTAPLMIATIIGVLFCILSFIAIIVIIVRTLIWSDPTSGWPSMVCIMFFLSGIQLFCTGIIGLYLSKTYLETKRRPIYIVRDTNM